jgi:hypothetical protein
MAEGDQTAPPHHPFPRWRATRGVPLARWLAQNLAYTDDEVLVGAVDARSTVI